MQLFNAPATDNASATLTEETVKRDVNSLHQSGFLAELLELTKHISDNTSGVAFAIDGVWGSGKSYFLNLYEEELNKITENGKNKYFVIHYNSWQYDYYDEPLMAIVSAIIDIIDKRGETGSKADLKKDARRLNALKAVGASLLSMAGDAVRQKTGIDVKSAFSIARNGWKTNRSILKRSHDYDTQFTLKQALQNLKELLQDISHEYTIVFLVDELDRCLPEYSIKVLERLHHLTRNLGGLITVIAVDKTRLQSSIAHLFGFEDGSQYLKRFIDFEIRLNSTASSHSLFGYNRDYLNAFELPKNQKDDALLDEFTQAVFSGLDTRECMRLIQRAGLSHKMLSPDKKKLPLCLLCAELLVVTLQANHNESYKFTPWFNCHCETARDATDGYPPFADFFTRQFRQIPWVSYKEEHTIQTGYEKTLYAPLAYVWYQTFLARSADNCAKLDIQADEKTKSDLIDCVKHLKKFTEMSRFIQ